MDVTLVSLEAIEAKVKTQMKGMKKKVKQHERHTRAASATTKTKAGNRTVANACPLPPQQADPSMQITIA